MKYVLSPLLLLLIYCGSAPTSATKEIEVSFDNKNVYYEGRVAKNKDIGAAEIYWPGSSVSLQFEGMSISAILDDEKGENYFTVVVDGLETSVLHLSKGKKQYVLADSLAKGKHIVELHKRNDWGYGKTLFYGYEVAGDKTFPLETKKMFIELYGDSITVGYANEVTSGKDRSTGDVTNNYSAYGAVTARNLNAEYSCIAHSGIGIMVSWHDLIMSEEYDRFDPSDATIRWDFTKKQPDVVVINLFQNDSWLIKMKNNNQFKKRFGTVAPTKEQLIINYVTFVKTIRSKYANAKIICMLGNMDITRQGSVWPGYVKEAVAEIDDVNIYSVFVPYKNSTGHPKVNEQKIIANKLTAFIQSVN
tara:strand:+ start:29863 stop:30945 length:1083 start_codon:yes stop_codon:yes gene_type:complete